MPIEHPDILRKQLKEIHKWEKDQQKVWFWEKLGRLPFLILDKLTPAFIQRKIGVILDEIGSFIQTGGQYLTSQKHIIKQISKKVPEAEINDIEDIKKAPLSVMEEISTVMGKNRSHAATVQGATTGIGGILTLAIDIPAVLGLSLKTLQDIAVAYGYNPKEKKERIFIVKCLQLASADVVGKKSILQELENYDQKMESHRNMLSQIQGWREVVYSYRDSFGWKKLLQMVPIAGILFGAITNRATIQELAETGNMLYKKRRIIERLEQHEKPETEIESSE
ncbi:EcsC family protein [Bacillus gobiensis]|uniref:EcsC family protein n=1 Tax=Bacillus gobiensis TaxID=1441095 RepID=UPI003D1F2037